MSGQLTQLAWLLSVLLMRGVLGEDGACKALQIPTEFIEGPKGAFNPAAVYNPETGWMIMMRQDMCSHHDKSIKTCPYYWDHDTHILVSNIGHIDKPFFDMYSLEGKIAPAQQRLSPKVASQLQDISFFLEDYR